MNIDKNEILEMLHSQGKHDQAAQVSDQLPDQVDTDDADHQNLLAKVGIDPSELAGKLGGLGGLGKLI